MAVGRRSASRRAALPGGSPDRGPEEWLPDLPLDGSRPPRRDDAGERQPHSGVAMRIHVAAVLAIVLLPAPAPAQTVPRPGRGAPLVLQRLDSGLVVAPDYKITSFD